MQPTSFCPDIHGGKGTSNIDWFPQHPHSASASSWMGICRGPRGGGSASAAGHSGRHSPFRSAGHYLPCPAAGAGCAEQCMHPPPKPPAGSSAPACARHSVPFTLSALQVSSNLALHLSTECHAVSVWIQNELGSGDVTSTRSVTSSTQQDHLTTQAVT